MEKLINPYDKEYMKMAMLKHEEIFREQVYELHRLYQTQKLLMKNMSNSTNRPQQDHHHQVVVNHLDSNKKITARQCIDLEIRPNTDEEHIAESAGEDELELTLGLSSYNVRRRRKTAHFDSSSPSFSSSNSTGSASSQIKHITTNLVMRNTEGSKWGLEEKLPVSNNFQIGGRTSQSNQNVDQDQYRSQDSLNNPPWLFQVLSLNMT